MSKFYRVLIAILLGFNPMRFAYSQCGKPATAGPAEAVFNGDSVQVNDTLSSNAPRTADCSPHSAINIAVFSTISASNKFAANPFISGTIGNYYFENRYNSDAANSVSINIGRQLNKTFAGFEITPMAGLVAGEFKGLTAEMQAYRSSKKWNISLDNQYTVNYATTGRSFYYNWTVARFVLAAFFQIGVTTQFFKPTDQKGVFDRGITTSVLCGNMAFNVYCFNFEPGRRNFVFSMRYHLKLK